MHNQTCSRITEELTRHLAGGAPLDAATVDHVRGCANCREVLQRAESLKTMLETAPVSEPDASGTAAIAMAAASAVKMTYQQRAIAKILAVGGFLAGAAMLWFRTADTRYPFIMTGVFLILWGLPAALAFWYARSVPAGGGRGIYRRLVNRQISGVCRGLSEAFGVPVWILRMMFVGLSFGTVGIWLYFALAILLRVHPEDRIYMYRYQIARWFRRGSSTLA